uniref:Transposase (Putative), gypsy type n=1 Tax=Tanacetum cinerariifolium TaxID=118510 RepID=A0A699KI02_TANCI|nr:hypothetical protein [Tanacetum cinerariifolium]
MTSATTITPTIDPAAIAKKRHVGSLVFGGDSLSAGGSHPLSGGFLIVPNVTSRFCMDDASVYREMVDEFPKFFASICGMKHDQLFTEFNVGVARQVSLSAEEAEATKTVHLCDEAQALREHNATLEKEKNELGVKVTDLADSVKVREKEFANLVAVFTSVKLQNNSLADQVHKLEVSAVGLQEKVTVFKDYMIQLEKFQDEKLEEVNEKFDKLCADFVEMALHLKEKFYPHLLTTISGHRCLLTHNMELDIVKCLNSTENMSVLGASISKAVEKGMLEGLSAGIIHGAKGIKLADVAAHNPSAKADYLTALQRLQNPHVNQLTVPIHHSSDQRVISAFALSLSLDVSHSRVRRIKENIANHVSALRGVFVPLSEPLSVAALEGTEGTSGSAHNTTTALSVTFVFASTILPNSTDDYEVAHADCQKGAGVGGEAVADENIDPFPDVSNAELNILE